MKTNIILAVEYNQIPLIVIYRNVEAFYLGIKFSNICSL